MIEDENTSPSEREAAEARVAEREEELARLQPQIQEREEALPWRERIENSFKKYGWTLQAIVLAAGIAIGAASLYIINALNAGTKAVGNGLKTVGKKLGSLLQVSSARLSALSSKRLDRLSPFSVSMLGF